MSASQITPLYRFFFLLIFSVALMIVDHRSDVLVPVRTFGSVLILPFQWLTGVPSIVRQRFDAYYPDDNLHRKYTELVEKQVLLEVRLQRFEALEAENRRLSKLLSASYHSGNQSLLAEIVEIGLDPFTHWVALNRGVESGVYLGQPVITPEGVLGQVSTLGVYRSVVTLITDPSHGIPVRIQRNGLHTIVLGEGVAGRANVPFLPVQADIRTDDILVTSGIGGGFPAGYKVARVQEIVTDANQAFLAVNAVPFADIKRAREVLLLWNDKPAGSQSAAESAVNPEVEAQVNPAVEPTTERVVNPTIDPTIDPLEGVGG